MINSSRNGLVLFSGNGNPDLSNGIADQLGMKLGNAKVTTFSDGEISINIEENVRGKDVFLIQPTCAPAGDNLLELNSEMTSKNKFTTRPDVKLTSKC